MHRLEVANGRERTVHPHPSPFAGNRLTQAHGESRSAALLVVPPVYFKYGRLPGGRVVDGVEQDAVVLLVLQHLLVRAIPRFAQHHLFVDEHLLPEVPHLLGVLHQRLQKATYFPHLVVRRNKHGLVFRVASALRCG